MKKICASLLLILTFCINCSALAQENWVFTAPMPTPVAKYGQSATQPPYKINNNYNNTDYYTNNGVSTDEAYRGRVDTSVYTNTYSNYNNSNNYSTVTPSNTYVQPTYTQPVTTTPTYDTQLKTTEAEPKKTFSEKHPILTGAGLGLAILGLGAISVLLSSDDNNKEHHRNCSGSGCSHHHYHDCDRCSKR